ncbi:MAG: hypothetical protein JRI68_29940 [Deltaproteobacteria bacterium]|nr:hypothetical protein [Deltaproteobacteria bacterium]
MDKDWNAVRFEPGARGHVESYFFKLNDPEGRRALWLKATILARLDGSEPVAEAWAIAFERGQDAVGAKQVVPYREASFSAERLDVSVGEATYREGRVEGAVRSGGHDIEYALDFTTDGAALVPFPHPKMYSGPLPSTKLVSPHPDSRYRGHYTVDGTKVEVDGWKGMQGHNWGKRHAELYGWAHCNQWEGEPDLLLEGVTARIKLGPVLAPPLTVVCLWHRGVRYEFNSPLQLLRARGEISPRRWSFRAASALAQVQGELEAATDELAGLYYENPDGSMTHCLNSKIARGRIRLEVKGRPPLDATTQSAALEIGTKDTTHGVRMLV